MEQEFYRDEFEQLLKDTTDDFKMYPSRKVWHSIYNDLHPDRKWPSFAVCLLLLSIILYVGVSNNNAISSKNRNLASSISLNQYNQPSLKSAVAAIPEAGSIASPGNNNSVLQTTFNLTVPSSEIVDQSKYSAEKNKADGTAETDAIAGNQTTDHFENNTVAALETGTKFSVTASTAAPENIVADVAPFSTETAPEALTDLNDEPGNIVAKPDLSNAVAAGKNISKDTREREWIEDFAFHNRKNSGKKLFKGLSTQFYVTPSVGYRIMFRNKNYEPIDNTLINNNNSRNGEKAELNQQAAMNMEAGFGITKNLSEKLRIKTGIQFNYTDYVTYAQRLDNPTETNLVLNEPGAPANIESFSASYAHVPGKNDNKLHNSSIQLSIPVGVDYRLYKNRIVSWYVGATVQPTMVARSYSYLLSSDNNYFIDDRPMLRKWNLNGAVESFVSIKMPSGTYINLGPQFRYQLFSSYSKNYMYTEKPYSVGFKIGFTRPL